MRYLRLHTLGFAALLVALTVIHCAPTEAQADRRRRWTTYGSERGRLVVACDMRSDTCSDGRKITTTRATPVPCEVEPGVWVMVEPNEGCYSVRGLESWGANTSYLAYGAELDHALWTGRATATKVGSIYRVCGETGSAFRQRLAQEAGGVVRTAACRVRAGTSNSIRLLAADLSSGGVNFDYTLTDAWQTVTATATIVADGGVAGVRIHPARAGAGCIDVVGCWSVRGTTPGRPCWGGEAPVTCAADRHTISTDGWPTESGEILVGVRLEGDASENRAIIDGGEGATFRLAIQTNNAIRLSWDGLNPTTAALPWEYGRTYVLRLVFAGTTISLYRDGVFLRDFTYSRPVEWAPDVRLGTTGTGWHLNGSVSSLRVRSFE